MSSEALESELVFSELPRSSTIKQLRLPGPHARWSADGLHGGSQRQAGSPIASLDLSGVNRDPYPELHTARPGGTLQAPLQFCRRSGHWADARENTTK
jgi:hypothetical protein